MGVLPATDTGGKNHDGRGAENRERFKFKEGICKDVNDLLDDDAGGINQVKVCMASCHTLKCLDNVLIGDPLDIKMFQHIGWEMAESAGAEDEAVDMSTVRPKSQQPAGTRRPGLHSDDLSEGTQNPCEPALGVKIVRQFTFNSKVARMSVIAKVLGNANLDVYVKGAPEKVEQLCRLQSIPIDHQQQLQSLTAKGFRVLSLAHRPLPVNFNIARAQKMNRAQVETNLTFLGFLIIENKLKPETVPVIKELTMASISTVMITGDNLMTAASVARECGMVRADDQIVVVEAILQSNDVPSIRFVWNLDKDVDCSDKVRKNASGSMVAATIGSQDNKVAVIEVEEPQARGHNYRFAITGNSWSVVRRHYPHIVPQILVKGTIFARMDPDQKAQLVEDFQNMDCIVCMCGDGANDCGALKAAHVGVSLSDAEASIAAPFTSRVASITCVPKLIKEGRCALVTSYGVFRFLGLQTFVNFAATLTLYTLNTRLSDLMFLFMDMCTTILVLFMGWIGPCSDSQVGPKSPKSTLLSPTNIFSIFAHFALLLLVQIGAYFYLSSMTWYQPIITPTSGHKLTIVCPETTTLFILSSFQSLVLAFTLSQGPPHRQPVYSNTPFFVSLLVLIAVHIILAIYPGEALAGLLELDTSLPPAYKGFLLLSFIVYAMLCVALETFVIPSPWLKKVLNRLRRRKVPKSKFKAVQADLRLAEQKYENFSGFLSSLTTTSGQGLPM